MEDVISVARGAAGHFAITIHESRDDGVGRKEGRKWQGVWFGIEKSLQ